MRNRSLSVAIAAMAFPLLAGGVSADDDNRDSDHRRPARVFRAVLLGVNEVPPVATPGNGRLRMELNRDETSIHFELSYRDLKGTPANVAHVHFGVPGLNGGVMFFFCGGPETPPLNPCPPSGTVEGDITAANVVGPVGQGIPVGDFAEVVKALRGGHAYANVHNPLEGGVPGTGFPGGQIRGQVVPSRF
jgi:hypothetical protein